MFSKNFNIIIGDRASGRTTFLFELARLIKSFGHKTCYIGGTEEFYEFANNSVDKIYDSAFFYKNDVRLFQNIKEIWTILIESPENYLNLNELNKNNEII